MRAAALLAAALLGAGCSGGGAPASDDNSRELLATKAARPASAPTGQGRPAKAPELGQLLPPGYKVLTSARLEAGTPPRRFVIVAAARRDEAAVNAKGDSGPPRPLLIFEEHGGTLAPVARNDQVVAPMDHEQCDPFGDDGQIAAKGRYFTVENRVSCGQHWTNFITFRFDDRLGFVFDNERSETLVMNSKPDGDALVRDGPQRLRRDPPGRVTRFADWPAEKLP